MSLEPEVLRRKAEWERQIETLDQKEIELHQTQLRLVREQTATFMQDLNALRQEVAGLRAKHEGIHSDLSSTIVGKHRELTSILEQERKDRGIAHNVLHNRIVSFEREFPTQKDELTALRSQMREIDHTNTLRDLKAAIDRELEARAAAHGSLEKKYIELKDNVGKHSQLHQEMDRNHGKMRDQLAQHMEMVEQVNRAFQQDKTQYDYHHGTLNGRLDNLEKDIQSKMANQLAMAFEGIQEVRDMIGGKGRPGRGIGIQERLDFIEKNLGDSADRQGKALSAHHASFQERLNYLEKLFGDSADKHDKSLDAAHKRLEQLHGYINEHTEKLGSHAKLHATIPERMNYVEKLLGDSADKHMKEIEALKTAHKNHVREILDVKGANAQHATLGERVNYLEKLLGDSADKHGEEIAALKDAFGRHVKAADFTKLKGDFDALKAAHATHASMGDRLDYAEKLLGDSADRHAQELKAAHAKIDALHGRVGSCEKHGVLIGDLQKGAGSMRDLDANHASLKERVDFVEKMLGDSADKHAKEIEVLKASHGKHAQDVIRHARELEGLKSAQQQHASVSERLDYMEKMLGDSADKHAEELAMAHIKLDQLHGRVTGCEKHGALIGDLQKAHGALSTEKKGLEMHHASLKERVDFLEKTVGESADRHGSMLDAAHSKIDQVHGRLAACEKLGIALGDLKKAHTTLAGEKDALDGVHATLRERVDYLETMLGASADRHTREVEALKAAHNKHAREMQDVKGAQQIHASVAERLNYVEKLLGDSADKHNKELSEAQAKLDQIHGRVAACEVHGAAISELKKAHSGLASEKMGLEAHHANLKERVDYLETLLGDSADAHGKGLASAHAKLDSMHSRLSTCEKHGSLISDLQKAHGSLSDDLKSHATTAERLTYLEQAFGDSADKHARELEALRAAHNKHTADFAKHSREFDSVKAAQAHHATMSERMDYIERMMGDSADKHQNELAAAHSKLEQLHGRLSSCEKHGSLIQELQRGHNSLKGLEGHHASMQERMTYLEKMLGDSAEKHDREVEALKAAHGRHSSDAAKQARDLEGLKAAHAQHSSVNDRLEYLEKLLGDSADKHAEELAAAHARLEQLHIRVNATEKNGAAVSELQKAHAGLITEKQGMSENHATLKERVDYLETSLGDSADKHAKALEALKAAHNKLANDHKSSHGSLSDILSKEKDVRDEKHASIEERMNYLEGLIGDNADKHAKELATQKAAQAKLSSESKARDTKHSTMEERIAFIEVALGDSADKHAKQLAAAHAKIEKMSEEERAARERHHGSVRELLQQERDAQGAHHSSIEERLKFLESLIGDNADKHFKELQAQKASHTKLANDAKARDSLHATLEERMIYLEKVIGDSTGQQKSELKVTQTKIEQMNGRLAAVRDAWRSEP